MVLTILKNKGNMDLVPIYFIVLLLRVPSFLIAPLDHQDHCRSLFSNELKYSVTNFKLLKYKIVFVLVQNKLLMQSTLNSHRLMVEFVYI